MKKLSEDLKKMLAGLASQDATDYLPISEKMKMLGSRSADSQQTPQQSAATTYNASRPSSRRIAFICDGSGLHAPLDYTIDACQRQNAQIDLLLHGQTSAEQVAALVKKIRDAGIPCHQVQLGARDSVADEVINYIIKHPSLIYIISKSDDATARILVEDLLPGHRKRIQVPVVLIEEQTAANMARQSAA